MRGTVDCSSALLWLMALAGTCAVGAGQQEQHQGAEDYNEVSVYPKSAPESSPYPPVAFDFLLTTQSGRKDPSSVQHQPVSTKVKMASIPSNSSDDECVGPPKKSKRPKKRSKNKSKAKDPKTTPPCPGNHAAKADASAAAQAPATGEPGASLEEPVDRASRGKTCVFVCLVDVACSEESPQCSTKVFLAGSYWCQFDFACPPFEPAFTVTYIPYKPPDAPTSTGSQMVIVEPPGPAASPVMADVTITASTAMPPTAAPGAAAPPGTDKNVSAGATALTTPGPIVTPVTVEGGPTPQEPGSPPGMPPATVRSGQGASSRPRKPPAPQCFYVCQREVCSADTCEVVEGSDFCTFWAMCPANPPASRVIYLPQDAETDPPGTVIAAAGAQTPEPLPGLNPAAAPGPVMQKRIGG